jgi:hypothetical protein
LLRAREAASLSPPTAQLDMFEPIRADAIATALGGAGGAVLSGIFV